MILLNPNDPVRMMLEHTGSFIEETAIACIETIFNKTCTSPEKWQTTDRLDGDFPHNICLGCGNDTYQAIAVIGTGDKEIMEFAGNTLGDSIVDVFGEMLNVYLGMLMDNNLFTDNFGILTQSIAQYSADINFYAKAWSIHGNLLSPKKGTLYIGFSIKKNETILS